MKALLTICAIGFLSVPFLSAKDLSLREKRLSAKPKFKIEKSVANTTSVSETFVNENDFDKTLRSDTLFDKTVRADKIGRENIFKGLGKAKQRRNTHLRELPLETPFRKARPKLPPGLS